MPTYEYRLLQVPESSSISQANGQIRRLVDEGWEPLFMSGDAQVNILFRRGLVISYYRLPRKVAGSSHALTQLTMPASCRTDK